LMVEGVIQRINERPWQNKKFYSFALSGQDGWFNTGMKRPPGVGTSVRFDTKTDAKGYVNVDGPIEIRSDGAVEPTPSVNRFQNGSQRITAGSQSNGAAGAYWDRKEARDVRNDELRELGASRNTALTIIDLMIKQEAVKLPAAGKREEFIWTLLDRYTSKLMNKSGGSEDAAGEDARSSAQNAKDDPQAGS